MDKGRSKKGKGVLEIGGVQQVDVTLRYKGPLRLIDCNACGRLTGGSVLRVAAEEWVPHIAVMDLGDGNFTIRGPMAKLLDALAHALNFRWVLPCRSVR